VIARVTCPAAAPGGTCRDVAGLYTTSGKLPATISRRKRVRSATSLGKARFTLRAGTRKTERIHLTHTGLGLAKPHKTLRLRLILASRDALGDRQTRVYGVAVRK
jgi:hypothetical protein